MTIDNKILSCVSYDEFYQIDDKNIAKCSNQYEKMSKLIDSVLKGEIKMEPGVVYDFQLAKKKLTNGEFKKLEKYCMEKTGKNIDNFIDSFKFEKHILGLNKLDIPKNYDENKNYELHVTLENTKENKKRLAHFASQCPKNFKIHYDFVEAEEKLKRNFPYRIFILFILIIIFIILMGYIYYQNKKK